MIVSHKAGHYCHFRVLCSVDSETCRKKSFGIYWEGDDTFDFKVQGWGTKVQKSCTRLLSRVLVARVVCMVGWGGGGEGALYTLFWVTGRLSCTNALSF